MMVSEVSEDGMVTRIVGASGCSSCAGRHFVTYTKFPEEGGGFTYIVDDPDGHRVPNPDHPQGRWLKAGDAVTAAMDAGLI